MAKFSSDEVLDALLNEIAEGNIVTVCTAQPTNRTEAVTTYKIADIAVTPGVGNGDFTIANGDTSGRKLTVSQQEDIPVDADGTASHIAVCDGTRLLYVTTCTAQLLTAGNTVTIPAWKIEIADPS